MKRIILTASVALVSVSAFADITVQFPKGTANTSYEIKKIKVSDVVKPRKERPEPIVQTIISKKGKLTIPTKGDEGSRYTISLGGENSSNLLIYSKGGEQINVDITSLSPLKFTMRGSSLMEGIDQINKKCDEILVRYNKLKASNPEDKEGLKAIAKEYSEVFSTYIAKNPESESSLYALLNIQNSEEFMKNFAKLPANSKNSIIYPMVENTKNYYEEQIAADKKREEMQSGTVTAPNFTLKDLDGKDVSLSDFRGKWVILDFWGSWCGWCIKGMPALKSEYEKRKGELEIIGIDCNESEEAWRKGVEKHKLPWVNVYNPATTDVCANYLVKAYPNKVIINPEGKIVNITVGEDPDFFKVLSKLMDK